MTEKQTESEETQVKQDVADKVAAALGDAGQPAPEESQAEQASEQPTEFEIDLGGAKRKVSLDEVTSLLSDREQIAKERAAVEAAREELKALVQEKQPKTAKKQAEVFDLDIEDEDYEPREQKQQAPQGDPRFDQLLEQIQPLLKQHQETAKTSYVEEALNKFPVFSENAEMRELAQRAVYDSMTANPSADIEKVVANYAAISHRILSKAQPSAHSPDARGRSEVLQAPVEPTFANLEAGAIREQARKRFEDLMRS